MRNIIILLAVLLLFAGCAKSEPAFYEISKDEIVEPEPSRIKVVTQSPEPSVKLEITDHSGFSAYSLVDDYATALTAAINNGSFSLVEAYLLPGSTLYAMQKKLVDTLFENGTKEYMLDVNILDEEWTTEDSGYIKTYEKAEIIYSSGKTEIKTYEWTYTIKENNGKYYLSDIKASK